MFLRNASASHARSKRGSIKYISSCPRVNYFSRSNHQKRQSWMSLTSIGKGKDARPAETLADATPAEARRQSHADASHLIKIEAHQSWAAIDLKELWEYRELLYFLTWRDIRVRYKQTLMGAAWVIVQPLLAMLVFTLFFNKLGGFSSDGIPYPLFSYAGLLPWTFFSNAVTNSTNSLINNSNLITKVYFPRIFIPAAAVAAGLVDLAVASVILLGLLLYYKVHLMWTIAFVPFFISLTIALALGVGMLISALTVKYRDLRHALPFLLQICMFASPIIYPARIVPAQWRLALALNPLTGIIEGFRSALVGRSFEWQIITISIFLTITVFVCGVYVFRRTEDSFADVI
jgi:lipopolysaccharide transport system permease protein